MCRGDGNFVFSIQMPPEYLFGNKSQIFMTYGKVTGKNTFMVLKLKFQFQSKKIIGLN